MSGDEKMVGYHNEMPRIGDLIEGRYLVRRVVGQGGMGIVFAVEDMKLAGRLLAMKVATTRSLEGAYSAEAATLMKLDHPNLPQITDYYPPSSAGGLEALVMEYIDGYTLMEWLQSKHGGMSARDMLRIAMPLCSALRYLHEQPRPIIHRDLKPSNIMIDGSGTVKLIDFGISRQFKEGKPGDTVQLGTAGYAAPERLQGGQSDTRSDIYGLGAVLYHLSGCSLQPHRQSTAEGGARRLNRLHASWPRSIGAVLERMVEPDPARRFQSMREVEQALMACRSERPGAEADAATILDGVLPALRQQRLVTVLGLSVGAGATFLAITLAVLLARRGLSVTAAEFAPEMPEWRELLPQSFQTQSKVYWQQASVATRSGGTGGVGRPPMPVRWIPWEARPGTSAGETDSLERCLSECNNEIQLVDLSGCRHCESADYWIRRSDHVVVVADPDAYKWQPSVMERLWRLQSESAGPKRQWHWIANKHSKFGGNRTWLSMLPDWPRAIVPLLPQEKLWSIVWSGKWPTDYAQLDQKLSRSLQPITDAVVDKTKAGRG